MKFGTDDRCECNCATPCPLGKKGIEMRCTRSEIENFEKSKGVSVREKWLEAQLDETLELFEDCSEMCKLAVDSLVRIAQGKSKDPMIDAQNTIRGIKSLAPDREYKICQS